MKIVNFFKNSTLITHQWSMVFAISIIATLLFYACIELVSTKPHHSPIVIPPHWQKIELSLHGNYLAQEGEYISIVENNGDLIIKRALLLEIKRSQTNEYKESFESTWKILIAIEPINYKKLNDLNLKKPQELYLSPYVKEEIVSKKFIKKEIAYEISY